MNIAKMTPAQKTDAALQLILEALVAELDRNWYSQYHGAKNAATAQADHWGIDNAFGKKVQTLRESGAITTPKETLRTKAEEISQQPWDTWFGLATQYAHALVKV